MGDTTVTRHLVLLHGMGATGEVWLPWAPLLERRWLAPDLAGHGWSPPLPEYSFAALAQRAAEGLGSVRLGPNDRLVLLGHSLGGVVALALAARQRHLPVDAVVGLGIKVAWSAAELAKADELAARPVTWFATRDEAARRYLRVSGLAGLFAPDHPVVDAGLRRENSPGRRGGDQRGDGRRPAATTGDQRGDGRRPPATTGGQRGDGRRPSAPIGDRWGDGRWPLATEVTTTGDQRGDGRWRLAMDPAAFAVGEPRLPALLSAVDVPVLLARGELDPMVSDAQLKELGVPVATLPGLGHNAHVEDPAAVLALLDAYL
ncbi:alpha/beta hydrolase [Micromonospora robiginosa]|uniref:Alpha/beta fold hydrolase n=1 Tax=Micromonospora robiginosa TaxID=2749844 RepID=A0A7L6AZC3_9ACTN|nr:alpha/beta fold hydrolase [Micromonospora ferruginea]QLQ35023.1 alpha/beta fold hydrolase [Micromonospora ferruginea]